MRHEQIEQRLSEIVTLAPGSHETFESGYCAMEAVSYLAGEDFTDSPRCACPVITAFVQAWNDGMEEADRNEFLKPLLVKIVGTRDKTKEEKRSLLAADWLVRTHTPAWLRLAGLETQAEALESLPEITDMAQVPSIRPAVEAARDDARSAGSRDPLAGPAGHRRPAALADA